MTRIRSIKPTFFTSETIGNLSPLARLLFAGLWTEADKAGRLVEKTRQLKVKLLPYDECDAAELLAEIAAAGLVERYEADGQKLIQINNFLEHQRPHPKEPDSDLPEPCKKTAGRGKTRPNNGQPGRKGREGTSQEGTSQEGKESVVDAISLPEPLNTPEFAALWAEWKNYKRERGESYKPIGERRGLAALAARGLAAATEALELSMAKNWSGPAEPSWIDNAKRGGGNVSRPANGPKAVENPNRKVTEFNPEAA